MNETRYDPVVLLWMEAGRSLADCSSPLFQRGSVDAPIALVLRLYQHPPRWSSSAALTLHRGFSASGRRRYTGGMIVRQVDAASD